MMYMPNLEINLCSLEDKFLVIGGQSISRRQNHQAQQADQLVKDVGMAELFIYGTLRDLDVCEAVLGRVVSSHDMRASYGALIMLFLK